MKKIPRSVNSEFYFQKLVSWFEKEIIEEKKCPGLLIGLSGTDSIVAFCAAAEAFKKHNLLDRILGIHFLPSEDFLDENPEAETHLWFSKEVIPWLENKYGLKIIQDSSIDWRYDGLRWGKMMDLSVIDLNRKMRSPDAQFWVMGTRNRTEDVLGIYSQVSTAASIQPLIHLWKSEVLTISEYLEVPKIALDKSCETDCICGRQRLAANHIQEVDWILMSRAGELSEKFIESNIEHSLRIKLNYFIDEQIKTSSFKKNVPYYPRNYLYDFSSKIVEDFENSVLDLKKFNHYQHMLIAFEYLRDYDFDMALNRYSILLRKLLNANDCRNRFDIDLTKKYFSRLHDSMKLNPTSSFDDLLKLDQNLLTKI